MSLAQELKRELPPWEQQTVSTQEQEFFEISGSPQPAEEKVQSGLVIFWPQVASISFGDFSMITTWAASSGVVTLGNLFVETAEHQTLGSGLVALHTASVPFHGTAWGWASFGQRLNSLLWAEGIAGLSTEERFPSKAKAVAVTEESLTFCSQYKLFGHLQTAIRLVKECFPMLQDLRVEEEEDPETEEKWLVLRAQVEGNVEAILQEYETYSSRLVKLIPWPERSKLRFSYDMV